MIRGMVEKLQARMDADGSDVEGWLRLAQSRLVLGENDRARATFEQALSRIRTSRRCSRAMAGMLLGPVRSRYRPARGRRPGQRAVRQAAGLQPDDPEVWWFLGVRALQDGRKAEARSAWEKVLARLDPAQPEYQDIKSRLDGLGS